MTNTRSKSEKRQPVESAAVRLQKVLAQAGVGSRRGCEQLILAGRVSVDGRPLTTLGVRVDPRAQVITVDGETIRAQRPQHFLLNKPRGYLCTNKDPQGRPRVIDLFPVGGPRLFTVGRLDENSQGLLMVTNDGDLAHRLVHPRYQVPRLYRVQVAGHPTRDSLDAIRHGVHFSDGFFRVHSASTFKTRGRSTFLNLELRQGQNREIRRLLARIGHKVMSLERISFGPLRLGRLKLGQHRPLRPSEFEALHEYLTDGDRRPHGRKKSQRRSSRVGTARSGGRKRARRRR